MILRPDPTHHPYIIMFRWVGGSGLGWTHPKFPIWLKSNCFSKYNNWSESLSFLQLWIDGKKGLKSIHSCHKIYPFFVAKKDEKKQFYETKSLHIWPKLPWTSPMTNIFGMIYYWSRKGSFKKNRPTLQKLFFGDGNLNGVKKFNVSFEALLCTYLSHFEEFCACSRA